MKKIITILIFILLFLTGCRFETSLEEITEESSPVEESSSLESSDTSLTSSEKYGEDFFENSYDYINKTAFNTYIVTLNGKTGVVNEENNIIIPILYETIFPMENGSYFMWQNDLKGIFDKNSDVVLEIKYEYISSVFKENMGRVILDGKAGNIDIDGNILIPLEYDFIAEYPSEGLLYASKNGKYGYIDRYNNIVVPFAYDGAEPATNGILIVYNKNKYYWSDDSTPYIEESKYHVFSYVHMDENQPHMHFAFVPITNVSRNIC